MTEKQRLRNRARQRLGTLTTDDRDGYSRRIADLVWQLPEAARASAILLYASVGQEVQTARIADEARRRGILVTYPRCLPEANEMTLHRVEDDVDLLPHGRFGIREPAPHCPITAVGDIDIAFLPGVGWDRSGHRLGRGAGFYDRLLSDPEWRAFACGLFFSIQEVATIPHDPWDVPLDAVVTERGVWRRDPR